MATIKERAQDYAYIAKERGDMPYELAEKIYIEIATEQMQVDIDRAWQWMIEHIKLIGSPMELHSMFRKAMRNSHDN